MNKNLEILAPVGSFEALKAAVNNGANAVYLGGKEFSARASANNFDRNELIEAVNYAHLRGVSVFVTVNTLIKQEEIDPFISYIGYLQEIGVDAVILQDIGMVGLIKKTYPNLELHASTQMAAHSLEDVLFLEKVGFKRVVLARELGVKEIKFITDNSNADIEVFVHGALCVAYSGQCLMSSVLGTRSGNRGRCAQPCRQKYKMYDIDNEKYVNTDGSYLLSPRDLNTIEEIGKIIDTNVLSLKIEGRMKKPEYVATVVSTYKKAIDLYLKNPSNKIDSKSIDDLYSIFNRGFTKGYILEDVGIDIMNSEKPNNQGLCIGTVLGYNNKTKKLKIFLEKELKKSDCLNIGGGNIGRIIKNKEITDSAKASEIVEIDFVQPITKGTKLYKTLDQDLINRFRDTFATDKEILNIPIYMEAFLYQDSPIIINVEDDFGNFVSVVGEKNVEKALKVSLDKEKVEKQLSKLGNTPYFLKRLNIDIQEGSSLPVSELNNTRRNAIDKLNKIREKMSLSRIENSDNKKDIAINKGNNIKNISQNYDTKKDNIKRSIFNKFSNPINKDNSSINFNVSLSNIEQLKSIIDLDVDTVYYKDLNTLELASTLCQENNIKLIYQMPRVIRVFEKKVYNYLDNIDTTTLKKIHGFRVNNYGEINYLIKKFTDKSLFISPWLNVLNANSIEFYNDLNASVISLSQEMSLNQIQNLPLNAFEKNNLEYMVYGKREMMLSEYCPMGVLTKDCKKNKRDALCKQSKYCLESSNGDKFRLTQDENCRTTIYSNEVLNLIEGVSTLIEKGIRNFEISLTFETPQDSRVICEELIKTKKYKKYSSDKLNTLNFEYETGHLYKEID